MATWWANLGVEITPSGSADLLRKVANVVNNPWARYVWRGHADVTWTLHSSLHRRLANSGHELRDVTQAMLADCEGALLRNAKSAGWDTLTGSKLEDAHLLAMLQHEGAATSFIDVTPDPYVALFFACEHAERDHADAKISPKRSCVLVAIRVDPDRIAPRVLPAGNGSVLESVRKVLGRSGPEYYLWDPYRLNERIKAQRGQFIIGDLPTNAEERLVASIPLELGDRMDNKRRVDRVIAPTPGAPFAQGPPSVIVFRIGHQRRRELRRRLALRFGYTSETIYPDFNGFANANSQFNLLDGIK